MAFPTLAKSPPRAQKAGSIADLLARTRGLDAPALTPPDSVSLPFGGLSPAQLAHEREVSTFRVVPTQFRSLGSKLVPYQREEIAEYEPIESVEGEVIESKPSEAQAEAPVTHVHVHLHKAAPTVSPVRRGFPFGRVIPPNSREIKPLVAAAVAQADAAIAESNKLLKLPSPDTIEPGDTEDNIDSEVEKLERLIDDDFPFDPTQLAAIHGMVTHQYAVMIGEAGTGKTTSLKKLVDMLKSGVAQVDLSGYWQRGEPDEEAEYERPTHLIPSICMVSFTGRASQMVKKNFPKTWHPNIMTIHRMLGFYPEFWEEPDANENLVNKKRFVPSYTAANPLPWKIIIIDEAGMLGLDLWHQLWAACLPDTRIYMIGDIRQLPPTHGKSVLGFALVKWPVYALTHVHRQKGVNNSIVDNAHRVMNGLLPVCDSLESGEFPKGMSFVTSEETTRSLKWLATNPDWRFLNIRVDENPHKAQQRIRQVMKLLFDKTKLYEPNRDIIITPTNGFEPIAAGYVLGQQPLNQGLVSLLNAGSDRYLIDAGREQQNFAVGDKVMATVNDYEAGITNGMTGIVETIAENGGYSGNTMRFGRMEDVGAYLDSLDSDQDTEDFELDDMIAAGRAALDGSADKEKRDSGPASHSITVRFGEGDHSFTVGFASKSQVASLMLAYAATCHKMQGGEAPLVFVIVHGTQKRPLNREWLYTAITRASGRCVLLSTRVGVGTALGKQSIKGKTLQDKIDSFLAMTQPNLMGAKINVRLPEPHSLVEIDS